MPKRHITTLPGGNVLVATFDDQGNASSREYTRRGPCVYVLQDQGPRLPAYMELRPHGEPLVVRRGESLEQTIRRELHEADTKNSRALTAWDAVFSLTAYSTSVAFLVALGITGLFALIVGSLASNLGVVLGGMLLAGMAGIGLRVIWSEFPKWHWLFLAIVLLVAATFRLGAVWLSSQPFNLIR
jgi:hypothetical protein